MGAFETIADIVTDNRTYYNCPKCGRRVWAYGSFVGNVCWDCDGTLGHALVKTADLATFGLTSTVVDAVIDNKTEYRCPRCGVKKWAYGAGIGRTCLECQFGHDTGMKHWFKMEEACDEWVSLDTFLNKHYNESGTVAYIDGHKFENVVPRSNLKNANDYLRVSSPWECGNKAINICLKIWGYNKQMHEYEYEHNPLGCGWTYERFYDLNIKPHFKYCGWRGREGVGHQSILWDYIDNTKFNLYTLIIHGGNDICAHYTVVLGVDTEKRHYLVTDGGLNIWVVDVSLLEMISTYKLCKSFSIYEQHSVYRVG